MKKLLLIAVLTFLIQGCATVQKVADTAQVAVVQTQDQHTPAEWATFYEVLSTVATQGETIAHTKTGQNIFATMAENAQNRAEYWSNQQ